MLIQSLIDKMRNYRDKFGLIVQKDGDGGDTLNRIAHYYGALKILNAQVDDAGNATDVGFYNDLLVIRRGIPNGRFRRHPDTTRWFSNINNVTRDQMGPTEATMVLFDHTGLLKEHLRLRVKRGLLHFSSENDGQDAGPLIHKFPDLPSPQELAVIIRGLRLWFLYPLLLLLDLALFDAVFKDIREGQPILNMAVSKMRYRTPFSMLAIAALKRKKSAPQEIRDYHSEAPGNNGIEPLGELMVLALERL